MAGREKRFSFEPLPALQPEQLYTLWQKQQTKALDVSATEFSAVAKDFAQACADPAVGDAIFGTEAEYQDRSRHFFQSMSLVDVPVPLWRGWAWEQRFEQQRGFNAEVSQLAATIAAAHLQGDTDFFADKNCPFRSYGGAADGSFVHHGHALFFRVWRDATAARRFSNVFQRATSAIIEQRVHGVTVPVTTTVALYGTFVTATTIPPVLNGTTVSSKVLEARPSAGLLLHALQRVRTALRIPPQMDMAATVTVDGRIALTDVHMFIPEQLVRPPKALIRFELHQLHFDTTRTDGIVNDSVVLMSNALLAEISNRLRHGAKPIEALDHIIKDGVISRALHARGLPVRMISHVYKHFSDELGLGLNSANEPLETSPMAEEPLVIGRKILMVELLLRTIRSLLRCDIALIDAQREAAVASKNAAALAKLPANKAQVRYTALNRVTYYLTEASTQERDAFWDVAVLPATAAKFGITFDAHSAKRGEFAPLVFRVLPIKLGVAADEATKQYGAASPVVVGTSFMTSSDLFRVTIDDKSSKEMKAQVQAVLTRTDKLCRDAAPGPMKQKMLCHFGFLASGLASYRHCGFVFQTLVTLPVEEKSHKAALVALAAEYTAAAVRDSEDDAARAKNSEALAQAVVKGARAMFAILPVLPTVQLCVRTKRRRFLGAAAVPERQLRSHRRNSVAADPKSLGGVYDAVNVQWQLVAFARSLPGDAPAQLLSGALLLVAGTLLVVNPHQAFREQGDTAPPTHHVDPTQAARLALDGLQKVCDPSICYHPTDILTATKPLDKHLDFHALGEYVQALFLAPIGVAAGKESTAPKQQRKPAPAVHDKQRIGQAMSLLLKLTTDTVEKLGELPEFSTKRALPLALASVELQAQHRSLRSVRATVALAHAIVISLYHVKAADLAMNPDHTPPKKAGIFRVQHGIPAGKPGKTAQQIAGDLSVFHDRALKAFTKDATDTDIDAVVSDVAFTETCRGLVEALANQGEWHLADLTYQRFVLPQEGTLQPRPAEDDAAPSSACRVQLLEANAAWRIFRKLFFTNDDGEPLLWDMRHVRAHVRSSLAWAEGLLFFEDCRVLTDVRIPMLADHERIARAALEREMGAEWAAIVAAAQTELDEAAARRRIAEEQCTEVFTSALGWLEAAETIERSAVSTEQLQTFVQDFAEPLEAWHRAVAEQTYTEAALGLLTEAQTIEYAALVQQAEAMEWDALMAQERAERDRMAFGTFDVEEEALRKAIAEEEAAAVMQLTDDVADGAQAALKAWEEREWSAIMAAHREVQNSALLDRLSLEESEARAVVESARNDELRSFFEAHQASLFELDVEGPFNAGIAGFVALQEEEQRLTDIDTLEAVEFARIILAFAADGAGLILFAVQDEEAAFRSDIEQEQAEAAQAFLVDLEESSRRVAEAESASAVHALMAECIETAFEEEVAALWAKNCALRGTYVDRMERELREIIVAARKSECLGHLNEYEEEHRALIVHEEARAYHDLEQEMDRSLQALRWGRLEEDEEAARARIEQEQLIEALTLTVAEEESLRALIDAEGCAELAALLDQARAAALHLSIERLLAEEAAARSAIHVEVGAADLQLCDHAEALGAAALREAYIQSLVGATDGAEAALRTAVQSEESHAFAALLAAHDAALAELHGAAVTKAEEAGRLALIAAWAFALHPFAEAQEEDQRRLAVSEADAAFAALRSAFDDEAAAQRLLELQHSEAERRALLLATELKAYRDTLLLPGEELARRLIADQRRGECSEAIAMADDNIRAEISAESDAEWAVLMAAFEVQLGTLVLGAILEDEAAAREAIIAQRCADITAFVGEDEALRREHISASFNAFMAKAAEDEAAERSGVAMAALLEQERRARTALLSDHAAADMALFTDGEMELRSACARDAVSEYVAFTEAFEESLREAFVAAAEQRLAQLHEECLAGGLRGQMAELERLEQVTRAAELSGPMYFDFVRANHIDAHEALLRDLFTSEAEATLRDLLDAFAAGAMSMGISALEVDEAAGRRAVQRRADGALLHLLTTDVVPSSVAATVACPERPAFAALYADYLLGQLRPECFVPEAAQWAALLAEFHAGTTPLLVAVLEDDEATSRAALVAAELEVHSALFAQCQESEAEAIIAEERRLREKYFSDEQSRALFAAVLAECEAMEKRGRAAVITARRGVPPASHLSSPVSPTVGSGDLLLELHSSSLAHIIELQETDQRGILLSGAWIAGLLPIAQDAEADARRILTETAIDTVSELVRRASAEALGPMRQMLEEREAAARAVIIREAEKDFGFILPEGSDAAVIGGIFQAALLGRDAAVQREYERETAELMQALWNMSALLLLEDCEAAESRRRKAIETERQQFLLATLEELADHHATEAVEEEIHACRELVVIEGSSATETTAQEEQREWASIMAAHHAVSAEQRLSELISEEQRQRSLRDAEVATFHLRSMDSYEAFPRRLIEAEAEAAAAALREALAGIDFSAKAALLEQEELRARCDLRGGALEIYRRAMEECTEPVHRALVLQEHYTTPVSLLTVRYEATLRSLIDREATVALRRLLDDAASWARDRMALRITEDEAAFRAKILRSEHMARLVLLEEFEAALRTATAALHASEFDRLVRTVWVPGTDAIALGALCDEEAQMRRRIIEAHVLSKCAVYEECEEERRSLLQLREGRRRVAIKFARNDGDTDSDGESVVAADEDGAVPGAGSPVSLRDLNGDVTQAEEDGAVPETATMEKAKSPPVMVKRLGMESAVRDAIIAEERRSMQALVDAFALAMLEREQEAIMLQERESRRAVVLAELSDRAVWLQDCEAGARSLLERWAADVSEGLFNDAAAAALHASLGNIEDAEREARRALQQSQREERVAVVVEHEHSWCRAVFAEQSSVAKGALVTFEEVIRRCISSEEAAAFAEIFNEHGNALVAHRSRLLEDEESEARARLEQHRHAALVGFAEDLHFDIFEALLAEADQGFAFIAADAARSKTEVATSDLERREAIARTALLQQQRSAFVDDVALPFETHHRVAHVEWTEAFAHLELLSTFAFADVLPEIQQWESTTFDSMMAQATAERSALDMASLEESERVARANVRAAEATTRLPIAEAAEEDARRCLGALEEMERRRIHEVFDAMLLRAWLSDLIEEEAKARAVILGRSTDAFTTLFEEQAASFLDAARCEDISVRKELLFESSRDEERLAEVAASPTPMLALWRSRVSLERSLRLVAEHAALRELHRSATAFHTDGLKSMMVDVEAKERDARHSIRNAEDTEAPHLAFVQELEALWRDAVTAQCMAEFETDIVACHRRVLEKQQEEVLLAEATARARIVQEMLEDAALLLTGPSEETHRAATIGQYFRGLRTMEAQLETARRAPIAAERAAHVDETFQQFMQELAVLAAREAVTGEADLRRMVMEQELLARVHIFDDQHRICFLDPLMAEQRDERRKLDAAFAAETTALQLSLIDEEERRARALILQAERTPRAAMLEGLETDIRRCLTTAYWVPWASTVVECEDERRTLLVSEFEASARTEHSAFAAAIVEHDSAALTDDESTLRRTIVRRRNQEILHLFIEFEAAVRSALHAEAMAGVRSLVDSWAQEQTAAAVSALPFQQHAALSDLWKENCRERRTLVEACEEDARALLRGEAFFTVPEAALDLFPAMSFPVSPTVDAAFTPQSTLGAQGLTSPIRDRPRYAPQGIHVALLIQHEGAVRGIIERESASAIAAAIRRMEEHAQMLLLGDFLLQERAVRQRIFRLGLFGVRPPGRPFVFDDAADSASAALRFDVTVDVETQHREAIVAGAFADSAPIAQATIGAARLTLLEEEDKARDAVVRAAAEDAVTVLVDLEMERRVLVQKGHFREQRQNVESLCAALMQSLFTEALGEHALIVSSSATERAQTDVLRAAEQEAALRRAIESQRAEAILEHYADHEAFVRDDIALRRRFQWRDLLAAESAGVIAIAASTIVTDEEPPARLALTAEASAASLRFLEGREALDRAAISDLHFQDTAQWFTKWAGQHQLLLSRTAVRTLRRHVAEALSLSAFMKQQAVIEAEKVRRASIIFEERDAALQTLLPLEEHNRRLALNDAFAAGLAEMRRYLSGSAVHLFREQLELEERTTRTSVVNARCAGLRDVVVAAPESIAAALWADQCDASHVLYLRFARLRANALFEEYVATVTNGPWADLLGQDVALRLRHVEQQEHERRVVLTAAEGTSVAAIVEATETALRQCIDTEEGEWFSLQNRTFRDTLGASSMAALLREEKRRREALLTACDEQVILPLDTLVDDRQVILFREWQTVLRLDFSRLAIPVLERIRSQEADSGAWILQQASDAVTAIRRRDLEAAERSERRAMERTALLSFWSHELQTREEIARADVAARRNAGHNALVTSVSGLLFASRASAIEDSEAKERRAFTHDELDDAVAMVALCDDDARFIAHREEAHEWRSLLFGPEGAAASHHAAIVAQEHRERFALAAEWRSILFFRGPLQQLVAEEERGRAAIAAQPPAALGAICMASFEAIAAQLRADEAAEYQAGPHVVISVDIPRLQLTELESEERAERSELRTLYAAKSRRLLFLAEDVHRRSLVHRAHTEGYFPALATLERAARQSLLARRDAFINDTVREYREASVALFLDYFSAMEKQARVKREEQEGAKRLGLLVQMESGPRDDIVSSATSAQRRWLCEREALARRSIVTARAEYITAKAAEFARHSTQWLGELETIKRQHICAASVRFVEDISRRAAMAQYWAATKQLLFSRAAEEKIALRAEFFAGRTRRLAHAESRMRSGLQRVMHSKAALQFSQHALEYKRAALHDAWQHYTHRTLPVMLQRYDRVQRTVLLKTAIVGLHVPMLQQCRAACHSSLEIMQQERAEQWRLGPSFTLWNDFIKGLLDLQQQSLRGVKMLRAEAQAERLTLTDEVSNDRQRGRGGRSMLVVPLRRKATRLASIAGSRRLEPAPSERRRTIESPHEVGIAPRRVISGRAQATMAALTPEHALSLGDIRHEVSVAPDLSSPFGMARSRAALSSFEAAEDEHVASIPDEEDHGPEMRRMLLAMRCERQGIVSERRQQLLTLQVRERDALAVVERREKPQYRAPLDDSDLAAPPRFDGAVLSPSAVSRARSPSEASYHSDFESQLVSPGTDRDSSPMAHVVAHAASPVAPLPAVKPSFKLPSLLPSDSDSEPEGTTADLTAATVAGDVAVGSPVAVAHRRHSRFSAPKPHGRLHKGPAVSAALDAPLGPDPQLRILMRSLGLDMEDPEQFLVLREAHAAMAAAYAVTLAKARKYFCVLARRVEHSQIVQAEASARAALFTQRAADSMSVVARKEAVHRTALVKQFSALLPPSLRTTARPRPVGKTPDPTPYRSHTMRAARTEVKAPRRLQTFAQSAKSTLPQRGLARGPSVARSLSTEPYARRGDSIGPPKKAFGDLQPTRARSTRTLPAL